MIRLVYVIRRLTDQSRQEFQNYWRDEHGPMVPKAAARIRITRYLQVHTIESHLNDEMRAARGTMEPYDGVAEAWWKNHEDLVQGLPAPSGGGLEDERRFIDFSRSAIWFAKDHVLVDGEPGQVVAKVESPIVQIFYALRRLPKLSKEEFDKYWLEKHGPLVRKHATTLGIVRYVQAHATEDALGDAQRSPRGEMEPPFDGHAEAWADLDQLARVSSKSKGKQAWAELVEDERHFVDHSRSAIWLAKEHVFYEA